MPSQTCHVVWVDVPWHSFQFFGSLPTLSSCLLCSRMLTFECYQSAETQSCTLTTPVCLEHRTTADLSAYWIGDLLLWSLLPLTLWIFFRLHGAKRKTEKPPSICTGLPLQGFVDIRLTEYLEALSVTVPRMRQSSLTNSLRRNSCHNI